MKKRKNVYIIGIVTLFIIIGIGLYQYNVQAPQEYESSNNLALSKVSNYPQNVQTYDSEGHPQVMTFYCKPTRVIVRAQFLRNHIVTRRRRLRYKYISTKK